MKVLSIGNSFSRDAHKWLHPMARAYNGGIHAVNLYICGCSLQTHCEIFGAATLCCESRRVLTVRSVFE